MEFKTKETYVAEFLREGILAGRFPRGQRLKQDDIAASLKISITPVREAFRMLEAEGYLLSEKHRGVVVAPFDAASAKELTELRVLLEGRLIAAAIARITPADLEELRKLQRELEKASRAGDWVLFRALNYRFHSQLYGVAGLPQTLHFVQVLWAKYPFDLIHRVVGRPGRALREHAALLKALATRDTKAALAAARTHIEAGWTALMKSVDAKADASSPALPVKRLASTKGISKQTV